VTLGLRPPQLKVASEDDSDEGGLSVTVDLVEELGNESYLYAHIDNTTATDLDGEPASVVARSQYRAPARIGQRVTLRKQGGTTYLFHPETGRRIGD
jgi:multiple sugar transport system ATP-binding protein